MRMTRGLYMSAAMLAITLALAGPSTQINAQTPPALSIGAAEIGGIVTGPAGPEAGVWVIAETDRPADQIRQDRRDRRSGPLHDPRAAEGQI
jgi:hypothetical protein